MILSGRLLKYNCVMPDGRVVADYACDSLNSKIIPITHGNADIGTARLDCRHDGVYFTFMPNNSVAANAIFRDPSFLKDWFNKKRKYYLSPHVKILKIHKKSAKVIRKMNVISADWTENPLPGGYINQIDT